MGFHCNHYAADKVKQWLTLFTAWDIHSSYRLYLLTWPPTILPLIWIQDRKYVAPFFQLWSHYCNKFFLCIIPWYVVDSFTQQGDWCDYNGPRVCVDSVFSASHYLNPAWRRGIQEQAVWNCTGLKFTAGELYWTMEYTSDALVGMRLHGRLIHLQIETHHTKECAALHMKTIYQLYITLECWVWNLTYTTYCVDMQWIFLVAKLPCMAMLPWQCYHGNPAESTLSITALFKTDNSYDLNQVFKTGSFKFQSDTLTSWVT